VPVCLPCVQHYDDELRANMTFMFGVSALGLDEL
jgi:hypothetical protein